LIRRAANELSDGRIPGPAHELRHQFIFGLLARVLQLGLIELQTLRAMVAPAQRRHVAADLSQPLPVQLTVLLEIVRDHGVMSRQPCCEDVAERFTVRALQFTLVGGELAHHFHGFLLIQPVFVTTVFPLGKVLRAHEPPSELLRDDALHFRQAI